MGVEKYIAIASLGLFAMFAGEIITLYVFVIDPPHEIEMSPKILQFISIGAAPALIMTAVSYIMSKRHGSKPIGYIIIAGGVVLLVGMIYAYTLIEVMDQNHVDETVRAVPPLFAAVSIPVMIVGAILLRLKKRRPKKEYV